MPYVQRRQQPFSPATAGNKSLIAWYDNSNAIYDPSQILSNNTLNDKGPFRNDVKAQAGFTTISSNYDFRKFTFSSSNYYINNDIEVKEISIGLTFFFVGALGYTLNGHSLINIYGSDILSIDANNGINMLGNSTGILIPNGNSNILLSGYITDTTGVLYINSNQSYNTDLTISIDKLTSRSLYIGSSNNMFNTNILPNIINTDINIYLPNSGSNIYPRSLNTVNEILIYNSVLNPIEINNIHSYLLEKWNIDSGAYIDIQNTSHLLAWYDLTNINNLNRTNDADYQINVIYDSGGLDNNIFGSTGGAGGTGYPVYNRDTKLLDFTNIVSLYNTRLFTGTGFTTGFTISLVVQNSEDNTILKSTILNIAPIDRNGYGPIITKDINRNIYGLLNIPDIYDISSNPVYTGFDNISDLYILTAQFQDYGNYQTSQIFINGRGMQILSHTNLQWLNNDLNSYNIFYGGDIDAGNIISCGSKLGETLIYKKILINDELNDIYELRDLHTHLSLRYNIDTDINDNSVFIWLILDSYSPGVILDLWRIKGGNLFSANSSVLLVREYMGLRVIDFNNGLPSFLSYSGNIITIIDNNFTLFIVIILNPLQVTDNNSSLFYIENDNNFINIKLICENNVWYIALFQNQNNSYINIIQINVNSLVNIIVFKAIGNRYILYSIPSNNMTGLSGNIDILNTPTNTPTNIKIGENCKHNIGEIMLYDRNLNQNEEVNILSYLQSRWKIPIIVDFPNDYKFWFDPKDISIENDTWTSKNGLFTLNYDSGVGVGGPPAPTQIINEIIFYESTIQTRFYNASTIKCNEILSESSSYTYFIVHDGSINDGIIFGIACGTNPYKLRTQLVNNSTKIYPIMYRVDGTIADSETSCYNTKLQNHPLYITCVSYDGIGDSNNYRNIIINTKGSFDETTNIYSIDLRGFTYTDEDIMLITIGGYSYYSPGLGILSDGNNYTGLIGDVIFYSRTLNDIEKLKVIQYLEAKYFKFREPTI